MSDSESESFRPYAGLERMLGVGSRFELTRFALLRLLGFVYTAAFVSLAWQVIPLLGARGITPAVSEVEGIVRYAGSPWRALALQPSLFYFIAPSDAMLSGLAW
ncbi:MAG: hypothetical protein ABW352_22515, partial [Polyangiales bacterium]